jgi:hypothetical protein
MKLMTKELASKIPALGAQDSLGDKAIVHAKFFTAWSNWTWLVLEYDPLERMCFGLVKGLEDELGYFSLDEIEALKGPGGMRVERDLYFTPKTLGECR